MLYLRHLDIAVRKNDVLKMKCCCEEYTLSVLIPLLCVLPFLVCFARSPLFDDAFALVSVHELSLLFPVWLYALAWFCIQ
jgi:hypothetical protein